MQHLGKLQNALLLTSFVIVWITTTIKHVLSRTTQNAWITVKFNAALYFFAILNWIRGHCLLTYVHWYGLNCDKHASVELCDYPADCIAWSNIVELTMRSARARCWHNAKRQCLLAVESLSTHSVELTQTTPLREALHCCPGGRKTCTDYNYKPHTTRVCDPCQFFQ